MSNPTVELIGFGNTCCFIALPPDCTNPKSFVSVAIKPTVLTSNIHTNQSFQGTFIIRESHQSWDYIPHEHRLSPCDAQGSHYNIPETETIVHLPPPKGQEGDDFIRAPNGTYYTRVRAVWGAQGKRDVDYIFTGDQCFTKRYEDPAPPPHTVYKNGAFYTKCNNPCESFQTIALECTLFKSYSTFESETKWFTMKYPVQKRLDDAMIETCCLAIALETVFVENNNVSILVRQSVHPELTNRRFECKKKPKIAHFDVEPCVVAKHHTLL